MRNQLRLPLVALGVMLVAGGCTEERSAVASAGTAEPAKAKPLPAKKPQASGKIARIVFIDLERCCACTRNRINASWNELTKVVGFPPVPDVERIHMDTQRDKAAPHIKRRAIMVPPALYFFEKEDRLAAFLQGEVTEKQVRESLK